MSSLSGPKGSTLITERNKKAMDVPAQPDSAGQATHAIFYGAAICRIWNGGWWPISGCRRTANAGWCLVDHARVRESRVTEGTCTPAAEPAANKEPTRMAARISMNELTTYRWSFEETSSTTPMRA